MRIKVKQLHTGNLGQVAVIEGWGSGILEGFFDESGSRYVVVSGVEHEMGAEDEVDIRRDAVLGNLHRREEAEKEIGGSLSELDLDRLADRILDALGLKAAVA